MEQLTKNQAVATSQEAVQNQNEPQLRDENAHNDKSVHGVLKTRDGLIRVRNIRALNGRFNTSITHAYSIVIGSKHITLNATGGGFLTASKQFRHGATSKSRS